MGDRRAKARLRLGNHRYIGPLFGGVVCYGHTTVKGPDPIRTR